MMYHRLPILHSMSTYKVLYITNSIPSYKLLWEHLCTAVWGQSVLKKKIV